MHLRLALYFLILCCGPLCAFSQGHKQVEPQTVGQWIEEIVARYRVPVGFVAYPLTSHDAVTVGQALKFSEKENLSLADKRYLGLARELKKRNPNIPDSNTIDYRSPQLTIDLAKLPDVSAALAGIAAADDRYKFEISNGMPLLYPANLEILGIAKVSLRLQDQTAKSSYEMLRKTVLEPNGIRMITPDRAPAFSDESKLISLNLEDADIATVLTRFCQSLGNDVGWFLTTVDNQKTLNIYQVRR